MKVEKNIHGAIVVSDIVCNQRVHKVYYGYSKAYAVKDFKKHVNKLVKWKSTN